MKWRRSCAVLIVVLGPLTQAPALAADRPAATAARVAPFGSVTVYKPAQAEPDSVALFVSGDGGWNSRAEPALPRDVRGRSHWPRSCQW